MAGGTMDVIDDDGVMEMRVGIVWDVGEGVKFL